VHVTNDPASKTLRRPREFAVLRARASITTSTLTNVVPPCVYHRRVLIHDRYGVVLTVLAAVGAVAAIAGFFRPRIMALVRMYLRGMIALVAIQVAIGLVLVATGDRPEQLIHWFYGAATLITLPVAMLIGKRLGDREERIWLAGGAVLTLLFALRAIATG
jgi:heme A synthase